MASDSIGYCSATLPLASRIRNQIRPMTIVRNIPDLVENKRRSMLIHIAVLQIAGE
jgi:hypothetical protein